MTKLQVKPRYVDRTGDTLYSSKEVILDGNAGSKHIITPTIGIDTKEIRRSDAFTQSAVGLSEIFRAPPAVKREKESDLNSEKNQSRTPLNELVYETLKQRKFYNEIQNQVDKLPGPVVFFFEFKDNRFPKEIELNFVLHTEHSFSDIPCLPITPSIIKAIVKHEIPFDDYLVFIKDSIEFLQKFNAKPIMGIVPDLSYGYLEELFKIYVENGLNAFCIDFDCHTPMSHRPTIFQCYRILKDYDMLDKSFFYALNVNPGRFVKNKSVISAKDVLSFGFGLDAMGGLHRFKFPPKQTIDSLGTKWKPLDRGQNKVRLFNRNDYGYYRAEHAKSIAQEIGYSSIPLETFAGSFDVADPSIRHCEKVFNMEQLGKEALNLQGVIKNDAPIKYLTPKAHLDRKDIKLMKEFNESIVHPQKSLDEVL